jgi:E-phenylitaconyl-CoA hydratase
MSFENLLLDKHEGVATITLNRPEARNAFTMAMAMELREMWKQLDADGEVICVVVTGAGEKAFCTGMDVADVASGDSAEQAERVERETGKAFYQYLTAIQNGVWKPVVTAVNGMVVGGGFHFLADTDLAICAEHATFFDTHVKVGLIAGLEPVGLARRIPLEHVLRLALLGGKERMTAQQALAIGLVGEVLPAKRVLPRAQELAAMIATHSPTALARTKRAIWESLDRGLHEGIEHAHDIVKLHTPHPDFAEGSQAFVEGRKPKWAPYTGEK